MAPRLLATRGNVRAIVAIETDVKIECALSRKLSEDFDVLKGFGASDCRCKGHLFFSDDYARLLSAACESNTTS